MKWRTQNDRELGKTMERLEAQIREAQNNTMVLWEQKLRLHVKPRPRFMPKRVWAALMSIVICQSSQEQFLAGSQPMPKEVIDVNAKNTQEKPR